MGVRRGFRAVGAGPQQAGPQQLAYDVMLVTGAAVAGLMGLEVRLAMEAR